MNQKLLSQQVEKLLQEKKIVMLQGLAQECQTSALNVAQVLPEDMCATCSIQEDDTQKFNALWQEMTTWPSATFIMEHGGSVVEIKGQLPTGKQGGGYFNLASGSALGGHIKKDQVQNVAFLSMPFMGLESHSVQFFDIHGQVLFSVYVGRENREIIPLARDSFFAMRKIFCESNQKGCAA